CVPGPQGTAPWRGGPRRCTITSARRSPSGTPSASSGSPSGHRPARASGPSAEPGGAGRRVPGASATASPTRPESSGGTRASSRARRSSEVDASAVTKSAPTEGLGAASDSRGTGRRSAGASLERTYTPSSVRAPPSARSRRGGTGRPTPAQRGPLGSPPEGLGAASESRGTGRRSAGASLARTYPPSSVRAQTSAGSRRGGSVVVTAAKLGALGSPLPYAPHRLSTFTGPGWRASTSS